MADRIKGDYDRPTTGNTVLSTSSEENHVFEGPSDKPHLSSLLNEVWKSGKLSDVTLSAKGTLFKLHSLVLASQITNDEVCNHIETSKEVLEVDWDPDILQIVLEYVYTNKVAVSNASLDAVADLAGVLGVKDLWKSCKKAYLSACPVTSNNCLKIWIAAEEISDAKLLAKAKSIAAKNLKQIKRSESFKALPFEILQEYISMDDLEVHKPDERLGAAMSWVRAQTKSRLQHLPSLLNKLPLTDMEDCYLDLLLDDPLIESQEEAHQILSSVHTEDHSIEAPVDDSEEMSPSGGRPDKELRLVVVGVKPEGSVSGDDVWAVSLQDGHHVTHLGQVRGQVQKDKPPNCCVLEDKLYVCGLGEKCQEIWCFNLDNHKSEMICSLCFPRSNHAMTVGSDRKIYLFGGYDPVMRKELSSIEKFDPQTGSSIHIGDLKYKDCSNLSCCCVQQESKILVCGAWNDFGKHTIQIFDEKTKSVTLTLDLHFEWPSYIYGAIQTHDYLVIIAGGYTAVSKLDDVIKGKVTNLRMCKHYLAPKYFCGVALSENGNQILLVGGESKSSVGARSKHVYGANVRDVIQDTDRGWQVRSTDHWLLGQCPIRGCDTGVY